MANTVIRSGETAGAAKRETAYPTYDLAEAIRLGAAVRDLGGSKNSVPKPLLASQLKMGEKASGFFQRISAAKRYGIIEGWGEYSLSEAGRKYFYPTTESDKKLAGLTFLKSPPAFKLIIDRFDGDRLPDSDKLANIVHTQGKVPESWMGRAASNFIRSAQFLGVIDQDGYLRLAATSDALAPSIGGATDQINREKTGLKSHEQLFPKTSMEQK